VDSFKDADGRQWSIRLTAYDMTRIRETCGVDLWVRSSGSDWDLSAFELWQDPPKFVGVVWAVVETQATAAGVSREQFERAYTPEVYHDSKVAFGEAILRFSPLPAGLQDRLREYLKTGEIKTDRPGDSTSSANATSWPGLSASTPDPLPSVS